jgi:hypothetical protein
MGDMLHEGSPCLDDILDLKAASKLSIPTRESQISYTLCAFSVILGVTVGIQNPCYEQIQPNLETLADTYPSKPVYAQVLRWIQLHFHEYWIELGITIRHVEAPSFHTLYEAIRYRQWIHPQIPATYLAMKKKKQGPGKMDKSNSNNNTGNNGNNDNKVVKADSAYILSNTSKVQELLEKGEVPILRTSSMSWYKSRMFFQRYIVGDAPAKRWEKWIVQAGAMCRIHFATKHP